MKKVSTILILMCMGFWLYDRPSDEELMGAGGGVDLPPADPVVYDSVLIEPDSTATYPTINVEIH